MHPDPNTIANGPLAVHNILCCPGLKSYSVQIACSRKEKEAQQSPIPEDILGARASGAAQRGQMRDMLASVVRIA